MDDDALWIDAARNGDAVAYGRLVRRYQDRLYNALLRLVGPPQATLDVVQKAFVEAYLRLHTCDGRESWFMWLFRIALRVAHDQPSTSPPPEDSSEAAQPPGEPCDPQQALHWALDQLPPEHREVLVLRELEGCCYETIAALLNVPPETVRGRLHRARGALRAQLARVVRRQPGAIPAPITTPHPQPVATPWGADDR